MKVENVDLEISFNEIKLDNEIVKIKTYLPIQSKINIIKIIEEEILNELIINQAKLDAIFNYLIIINYTNIEIDDKLKTEKQLIAVYDYFENKGYLDLIINAIPELEYNSLVEYLKTTIDDYNRMKIFRKEIESFS